MPGLHRVAVERGLELPPGPEQPRLDRADRHVQRLGDLAIAQALHVAQHQHLAELGRQRVHRLEHLLVHDLGEESALGIHVLDGR